MLVFTISSLIILRKLMSNDTTTSVYIYFCNTYVHLKCLHNISYNLWCFHFEFKWNQKVICCKRPSQTVTMKHSLLLHLFTIGVISAQSPGSCPDLRGIPDFKDIGLHRKVVWVCQYLHKLQPGQWQLLCEGPVLWLW